MKNKMFETVDLLYDKYVNIWEKVCNLESPTDSKSGVDAVGNFFADMANDHGWSVERLPHNIAGDVICITLNSNNKASPLSLSAHMDTVHPIGSFGFPAVKTDGEKIYGPGVCDCKGGAVAALLAMDSLDRCGYSARPIQLLLQTDEEVGSAISNRATINYICEKAKNSVAFLNLERHSRGEACLVRKGIINFKFTVFGQAAHSSNCATEGANAIAEAAYKIIELEKLKDDGGITCNCGIISGGTVPNTVPEKCEFQANVRFSTAEQLEWVRKYVKELSDSNHIGGCVCRVEELRSRSAMEYSKKNEDLLRRINMIFEENQLPILRMSKRKGGSDAADITIFGIPCVDSIGVEGGKIHSREEFAYLESLKDAAKRIIAIANGI